MGSLKHFRLDIGATLAALAAAWAYAGWPGFVVVAALGVLESSLSFDNAIVNAAYLRGMTEVWRRRFLTWGMLIAVFGMRLVFPLAIVSTVAWISPWAALHMALDDPPRYAATLASAHVQTVGFGGAFLLMLFFNYFLDPEKDVHWIGPVERPCGHLGRMEAIPVAATCLVLLAFAWTLPVDAAVKLLQCGMCGVVSFIVAEGVASLAGGEGGAAAGKAGAAGFMFLEIQDASFSFDGVVGALAVSNNLVLIALGLGVGALFVRSFTLLMVERGTLQELPYLEHGAFWAVGAMSAIMLVGLHAHVPDYVTGLIMAAVVGAALATSVRHNRRLLGGDTPAPAAR